jgi:hypothetical protein
MILFCVEEKTPITSHVTDTWYTLSHGLENGDRNIRGDNKTPVTITDNPLVCQCSGTLGATSHRYDPAQTAKLAPFAARNITSFSHSATVISSAADHSRPHGLSTLQITGHACLLKVSCRNFSSLWAKLLRPQISFYETLLPPYNYYSVALVPKRPIRPRDSRLSAKLVLTFTGLKPLS